jgi:hypothetical protein
MLRLQKLVGSCLAILETYCVERGLDLQSLLVRIPYQNHASEKSDVSVVNKSDHTVAFVLG